MEDTSRVTDDIALLLLPSMSRQNAYEGVRVELSSGDANVAVSPCQNIIGLS